MSDSPMPYQVPKIGIPAIGRGKKSGQGAVDLAGERPRRLAMAERHKPIDRRDHLVPIEKHIEGDDRRYDKQRNQADQRLAAPYNRIQKRRRPLRGLGDEILCGACELCAGITAEAELVHQDYPVVASRRRGLGRNQFLQLDGIFRQRPGETYKLAPNNGYYQMKWRSGQARSKP